MKLREVKIKNFRNLVDINVPIDDTTILVGENNSGKTAFLDALRIVLTRSSLGKSSPFDEYDYYMNTAGDSPQTSEGIIIELWFREDKSDEWPDSLVQALSDIIDTDPVKDIDYIGLRVTSKYDELLKQITSKWEFLTIDGQPLGGKGANPGNVNNFLNYVRLFYLSALRDSNSEFSARSQYWGKILRDLKIDETQKIALMEEITKLNDSLLKADTRLEQVRTSLDKVQKIMSHSSEQVTSIQALPLKPWDLMSKSEVVVKAQGSEVVFPLARHGQGIQSLSVLFLFQAYIEALLKPTFKVETVAILALEEPEAHLHPQAIRSLAANFNEITSQKIISSHSPYFVQEIPFMQIRMFRRDRSKSKVLCLKQTFSVQLPFADELRDFCRNNSSKFEYDESTLTLTVKNKIEEQEYRNLLTIYSIQRDIHPKLKRFYEETQLFLSDSELSDLNTYVKRIRGEVLFARAWLLCEGQSEYLLIRYFAELLGTPLDNAGVTIIDYQNNGSPGAFVGLANVFEIPWIMMCDNDNAGKDFIKQVKNRGLTEKEMGELVRPLPEEGLDLEMYLVKNGFTKEYIEILNEQGIDLTKVQGKAGFDEELIKKIQADKTVFMLKLIEKLRNKKADKSKVPLFFENLIKDIITKAV